MMDLADNDLLDLLLGRVQLEGEIDVAEVREVLASTGLAASKSEAQRLIRQRAVKRDGIVVESDDLAAAPGDAFVISVGAVRFVRIEVPKRP